MLVHCSEGGGRTGVFCQVDAQLELLEEDGVLDVFGYLKKLKSSRKGMLENVVSFLFLRNSGLYVEVRLKLVFDVLTGTVKVCVRYTGRVCNMRKDMVPSIGTV